MTLTNLRVERQSEQVILVGMSQKTCLDGLQASGIQGLIYRLEWLIELSHVPFNHVNFFQGILSLAQFEVAGICFLGSRKPWAGWTHCHGCS